MDLSKVKIDDELCRKFNNIERAIGLMTREERDLYFALLTQPVLGRQLVQDAEKYNLGKLGKVLYGK